MNRKENDTGKQFLHMMEDETLSRRTVHSIFSRKRVRRNRYVWSGIAALLVLGIWFGGRESNLYSPVENQSGSIATVPFYINESGTFYGQAETAAILWQKTDEAIENAISRRYSLE